MDKLKKYNQKILAVLGTLTVAILAGFIIVMSYLLITELVTYREYDNRRDEITLEDNRDSQNNKLRDQVISFNKPQLIDTINAVFLIPVSTIDLENPEIADFNEISDLLDTNRPDYAISMKSYKSKSFHGSYNNIVIYFQKTNRQLSVFNTKINISNFRDFYIADKQYILINAIGDDTNKDEKLSIKDLSSFYCYSITDNKLNKITIEHHSLISYSILYDTEEVLLTFGFDKNKDGKFDPYREPAILKTYSVVTNEVQDLVKPQLRQKLQKLLDE